MFAHLFEDPDDLSSHGLRIPVWHWRSVAQDDEDVSPPVPPALERAERCVVVPLLDDEFVGAPEWDGFLRNLHGRLRPEDLAIPVALSEGGEYAWPGTEQPVRLHPVPDELRASVLLNQITYRLCRLLEPASDRLPVFVSHAMSDGGDIAKRVSSFLLEGGSVEPFFAPRSISPGDDWRQEIEQHARTSLLLAIRSDAYATREWCQFEVLTAKLSGMPVVVLDALLGREARSFPYLGNTPVIRWQSEPTELALEQLLGILLREALRFRFFERRVSALCKLRGLPVPDDVQPAPPELLTMLGAAASSGGDKQLLVYPDPPLGTAELDVLRQLAPHLTPVTPLNLIANAR